jgi:hypothetical protein
MVGKGYGAMCGQWEDEKAPIRERDIQELVIEDI